VKAQSFTAVIISVFFLLTVDTSAAAHLRLALTRSLKVFPDDALGGNRAADRTWLIPRNGTQASNSPSGPTRPFPNSPYRLLLTAFQALLTSIDPLTALRQE
jgi:hypothetical protein